jgi:hypothetical protein
MSDFHDDAVLPPNFSGGFVNWRVRLVHWAAKTAGLLVKVEGFPYGTRRNHRQWLDAALADVRLDEGVKAADDRARR